MNKVKSLFIGVYPMFAMGVSGYGIFQLLSSGFNLIWLGAVFTTLPIILFISRAMLFKNMARTSKHFPLLTAAALLGVALAFYGFYKSATTNPTGIILTAAGFVTFLLYNFWYSSLGRDTNPILLVGNLLPKFSAIDVDGNTLSTETFNNAPAVYLFFRGNWCPLCMAQIKEIAKQYKELSHTGARVILISPQPEKNTQILANKFNVPFIFLTDVDNKAARLLGIEMKNGLPAGMEMFGYQKDTVFPTVIITDANQKIIYCDATDSYRIRPEPKEFLKVLNQVT